jgi:hypothetical protein
MELEIAIFPCFIDGNSDDWYIWDKLHQQQQIEEEQNMFPARSQKLLDEDIWTLIILSSL